ncbi:MAG: UDP-N-acetylmuramoyl-tripeptide--D-alanyl-D-alanine ligase [Acidobacteriota bacterium]
MLRITVRQAMVLMKARLLNPGADTGKQLPAVSIDSRTMVEGQAFFAIVGEKQNGHRFLSNVVAGKPGVVVVSDPSALASGKSRTLQSDRIWNENFYEGNTSASFLQVSDTTKALQDLARGIRNLWNGPLIGITGSMGKTTTRYYASSLLQEVCPVHSTNGNLNNHIGLPLSLINLENHHAVSILELGMNHAGEIRLLAGICRPDTAVITNVAPVHLEFFESLEKIAEAKAEILENLPPQGIFVYNLDDKLVTDLARGFQGRKISFGFSADADVRISDLEIRDIETTIFNLTIDIWKETVPVVLRSTGKTGALNLAAAAAAVIEHGLTPEILASVSARLSAPGKRGQIFKTRGITIWDDSYNSNPSALTSLLESVKEIRGFTRIILVLGDMLELGSLSAALHESCGRRAAESGAHALFTVGKEALMISRGAYSEGLPADNIFSFSSSSKAAKPVREFVREGDLVIVKGSRSVKMEKIIANLREEK